MESPGFANQASSYSAEVTRRAVFSAYARTAANIPGILAGGLLSATDMQLSAPGSGLSVNVSTGEAIVGGSEGGSQGGYYARNASTTNPEISTANPSNPRIDTVCVTIADSGYTEPTGVSGNAAVLQVVTGTPTSGANLTNLSGKAALPLSSLLLGYVLVPAAASNIITADISNRAPLVTTQPPASFVALASSQALQPAAGQSSIVWPGSSNLSSTTAITHGLGRTPQLVELTPTGAFGQSVSAWVTGVTTTQITYQVFTSPGVPGAGTGTFGSVYWLALG